MEHQFRRGIYRPNAQRLSISLAPLVAQRSLLFRVKADLATKTNYGELTPTEESPGLFLLSASTHRSPSAKIISAALSALSAASVYSQASWQGEVSPFGAILAPVPPMQTQLLSVGMDSRRHAMAFSPGVQWEDLLQKDEDHSDSEIVTPPAPAPLENVAESVTIPPVSLESEIPAPILFEMPVIKLDNALLAGKPKKSGSSENLIKNDKRISKHAKALSRVMGHLSLQPSKKDTSAAKQRRKTAAVVTAPEYKLPELKPEVSFPLHMSFISNSRSPPAEMKLPVPAIEVASQPTPYIKTSQTRQTLPAMPKPSQPAHHIRARQTMPPTPMLRRSSTPPPPATPLPMVKKGHRRYKSSPAVGQFDFNIKSWEKEDMPPLPATLNLSVPRPRAGSRATRVFPPGSSVVPPPFPVHEQGLVMSF